MRRVLAAAAAVLSAAALTACDPGATAKDAPTAAVEAAPSAPRPAPAPPAWAGALAPATRSDARGTAEGGDPGRLLFDGQRAAPGGAVAAPVEIELGRRPPLRYSKDLPYIPRDLDLAEPPPPVVTGGPERYAPLKAALVADGADPRVVDEAVRQSLAKGMDPLMALAVAAQESGLRTGLRSRAGALGAMQLKPGTACDLGVCDRKALRWDPRANVRAGLEYLEDLWDRFVGKPMRDTEPLSPEDVHRVAAAVAAYNAGPNVVGRGGGVPHYTETEAYVRSVLDYYSSFRRYLAQP